MTLRWIPPNRLPIGTGDDRVPSDPRPVGMGGGGVPNGIWDQVSSSSFSIWACLIYPNQAHDERMERTDPDRPKISRRTRPLDTASLGGAVFHWDTPIPRPPLLSSTTSVTVGEGYPRRRGARAGRVKGGQPGI